MEFVLALLAVLCMLSCMCMPARVSRLVKAIIPYCTLPVLCASNAAPTQHVMVHRCRRRHKSFKKRIYTRPRAPDPEGHITTHLRIMDTLLKKVLPYFVACIIACVCINDIAHLPTAPLSSLLHAAPRIARTADSARASWSILMHQHVGAEQFLVNNTGRVAWVTGEGERFITRPFFIASSCILGGSAVAVTPCHEVHVGDRWTNLASGGGGLSQLQAELRADRAVSLAASAIAAGAHRLWGLGVATVVDQLSHLVDGLPNPSSQVCGTLPCSMSVTFGAASPSLDTGCFYVAVVGFLGVLLVRSMHLLIFITTACPLVTHVSACVVVAKLAIFFLRCAERAEASRDIGAMRDRCNVYASHVGRRRNGTDTVYVLLRPLKLRDERLRNKFCRYTKAVIMLCVTAALIPVVAEHADIIVAMAQHVFHFSGTLMLSPRAHMIGSSARLAQLTIELEDRWTVVPSTGTSARLPHVVLPLIPMVAVPTQITDVMYVLSEHAEGRWARSNATPTLMSQSDWLGPIDPPVMSHHVSVSISMLTKVSNVFSITNQIFKRFTVGHASVHASLADIVITCLATTSTLIAGMLAWTRAGQPEIIKRQRACLAGGYGNHVFGHDQHVDRWHVGLD